MNLTGRMLLGYFIIVSLAAWFVLRVFTDEVKPGVKYALEDTLIDTSQILAELAGPDMKAGTLRGGHFAQAVARYEQLDSLPTMPGFKERRVNLRVYVTDARGTVVYDSTGEALGRDYSQWNDVYLTLRGKYGARSTKQNPDDELSSVMYVAAPVMDGKKTMGVLTVAKPTSAVQPFIDRSRRQIAGAGLWLMGGALLIGMLFAWWLSSGIGKLRRYARDVSLGSNAPVPAMGSGELAELGKALSEMRKKLDGREYVENYVHHLAHEMRSPLTALIGSAELLDEKMPPQEHAAFTASIREQGQRLRDMMDKLLALARLEQRHELAEATPVNLGELVEKVIADHAARMRQRRLACRSQLVSGAVTRGESFLLRQALSNLLDNAIDFSPEDSSIEITLETVSDRHVLTVRDHGPGIPDFALPRVFERFYSLARPNTQRKSTGLGLPFVREAIQLHGGSISLETAPQGGAIATLTLPAA